ncbi:MAG: hypothetical protein WDZ93_03275 [Candidatus Paceibacterota bacterium]
MRQYTLFSVILAGIVLLGTPALAQECADLTTLQRLAGYVTFMNVVKFLGATLFAAGLLFLLRSIIVEIVYHARVLIEMIGYIASLALIASGYWVNQDHLTWTVFTGCILFAGTVFATLWIHNIKGTDPKPLAALFMVVWGAVAVFYNMPEVGFLSALALMTILGFSVVVGKLSYGFGFADKAAVPTGTTGALLLLLAFVGVHLLGPDAPAAITVFKPGVFWVSSFVAFVGLLIMSSNFYSSDERYMVMQFFALVIYFGLMAIGLVAAINPLAGMAGTFLVLYLAAKPIEVPRDSYAIFGVMLMLSGGILYGAWWYASQHTTLIQQYLTTQL